MSKLVIKQDKLKAAQSTSLQSTLDAMLAENQAMLAEKQAAQQYSLLLCDVSGSMSECARGERKIDTLARTVNNLVREKKCKIISFSANARNVSQLDPVTRTSTNLAAALRLAKTHKDANQVIVISDGLPNSESEALTAAKSLTVPISCIYVGPGGDQGYAFLRFLARLGKGKSAYTGEDLTKLNKALTLMLPNPK